MSKLITIARPYAKAALDFAIEQHDVACWQSMLMFSAEMIHNKQIAHLLASSMSPSKLAEIFIALCGDQLNVFGRNFIRIIAKNNRLAILPKIFEYFVYLRMIQEDTTEVNVIAAMQLKESQLKSIACIMEQRLLCRVKLNFKIDKSIIAGIIIYAGDTVIDSSIRSRRERLADILLQS